VATPLERMRGALRPYHDRIEQTVDLMHPAITRDDYRAFLVRTLGFIEPCEAALRRARGTPPADLAARWKTELLRTNLAALGIEPSANASFALPADLPHLDRWPDALGYLYVIEGSTLGGQVLLRHLARHLALADAESVFLRGYDREVGGMWKALLAQLTAALSSSAANESAIVETARQTFVTLEAWHRRHRAPEALRRTAT